MIQVLVFPEEWKPTWLVTPPHPYRILDEKETPCHIIYRDRFTLKARWVQCKNKQPLEPDEINAKNNNCAVLASTSTKSGWTCSWTVITVYYLLTKMSEGHAKYFNLFLVASGYFDLEMGCLKLPAFYSKSKDLRFLRKKHLEFRSYSLLLWLIHTHISF